MIEKMMWVAIVVVGVAVAGMVGKQHEPQANACAASLLKCESRYSREVCDLSFKFCVAGLIQPAEGRR